MSLITHRRTKILAATIAAVTAAGVGVAVASTASHSVKPPSNAMSKHRGINEFGMTKSYFKGHKVDFTYAKGYYCDTKVKSAASTNCEAGKTYKKPPAKDFDPLYITVPLGNFAAKLPAMSMQCPTGLVCVDHPGTIDLSKLEPTIHTIAPYSSLSNKALTKALKNYATPGHEHFITTTNGGKAEWWDVKVVGVTSHHEWNKLNKHGSAHYLLKQSKAGNVTPVIPTNLFLYFGVN